MLGKPSLRIFKKIQLRNLNQTSAANFRILTKPCAQSLNKSLALCPNLSFHICNKLLPTRASASTWHASNSKRGYNTSSQNCCHTTLPPQVLQGHPSFSLEEVNSNKPSYCLGFKKIFNMMLSCIGWEASRRMRNIETFLSKQMYLNLWLVER